MGELHGHRVLAQRRGFTAIEMLVVLGVVIMLTAMTVPFIIPAITAGRVNEAANMISHSAEEARLMAIGNTRLQRQLEVRPGQEPIPYGFTVSRALGSDRAYVVLVGWREGSNAVEEISERRYFHPNVDMFVPVAQNSVTYHFSFRTGRPGTFAGNVFTALNAPVDLAVATRDVVWDDTNKVFTKGLSSLITLYNTIGLTYVR